MKKLFLMIGIFTAFTISQVSAQNKMWKPLPITPYRGAVTNTAVAMDGKIYVTTNNLVYRSTDKGRTWDEFPGRYGGNFSDLATYGSNTSGLFVGTDWHIAWTLNDGFQWNTQSFKVNSHSGLGGGVGKIHVDNSCGVHFSGNYMIQPSGNWREILPGAIISDYIFDFPGTRPILALAGGTQEGKIYQSKDGGYKWEAVSDMPSGYGRIFKADETVIVAQLDKYESPNFTRLYMASADYGKTWTNIDFKSTGLSDPASTVTIHAIRDGKIYASEYNVNNSIFGFKSLYVSSDNMQSWQLLHPALEGALVNEIEFMYDKMQQTGDIVIVTNNRGVLYFDVKNNSVEARNNGLMSMNAQEMFFTQNTMFSLDFDGAVSSENGGMTWNTVSVNGEKVQPYTMKVMPNGDVFLGTLATKISGNSLLYKSTDGGATWVASDNGMMSADGNWGRVEKLEYDNSGKMYAGVFQNNMDAVYFSKDDGQNWAEISFESLGVDFAFWDHVVKSSGELIILGSKNFSSTPIFLSTVDQGRSWSEIFIPENLQLPLFTGMTLDHNGNIYVQNVFRNMYKYDGATWTALPESIKDVRFYFDKENNMYQIPTVGNTDWNGVKFSADGGITWEEVTNGLPENADEYTITGLAFDNNNTPYVSLSGGRVYKLEQLSSVQEDPFKEMISVMPNPATENVTISFKSDAPAKITLYSILGEVVYSNTMNGDIKIDTKEFAPGVYHFTLSSGNTFKTGSIVKK